MVEQNNTYSTSTDTNFHISMIAKYYADFNTRKIKLIVPQYRYIHEKKGEPMKAKLLIFSGVLQVNKIHTKMTKYKDKSKILATAQSMHIIQILQEIKNPVSNLNIDQYFFSTGLT
jgi:endo-beta-N-acetylglucosaminidase D